MPTHFDRYKSPHNAEDLFNLVADVEKYPEFLPWVAAARINDVKENSFVAELVIKFKAFSHKYSSLVTLHKPDNKTQNYEINVSLVEGPFKRLKNHWIFRPIDEENTEIVFELDFEFKSIFFEKVIGTLFEIATKKMTKAFEERANEKLS